MKTGRTIIGIFQKMGIKNLRGAVRSDFKKLKSFTLETSKNHLIRNFRRNGHLRVKISYFLIFRLLRREFFGIFSSDEESVNFA